MTDVYKKQTRRRPIALGIAILAIVAGVTSTWWIRHAISTSGLKEKIENYLSEELDGTVTIHELDGRLFPRVALSGNGVVVRHHGHDDEPPLLKIDEFEISGSYRDLMFA